MAGPFEKDFGYLIPFLDRVAAAAGELADPAARAELSRLMAEEKQRWARIQALLSGEKGAAAPSAAAPSAAAPSTKPDAAPGFTVGSLRRP